MSVLLKAERKIIPAPDFVDNAGDVCGSELLHMFSLRNKVAPVCRLALVIGFFLLALAGPLAANPPIDERSMLSEIPSSGGQPLVVEVGVFIIDIDEIDRRHVNVSVSTCSWRRGGMIPALHCPSRKEKG